MARKAETPAQPPPPKPRGSALTILEWDEGSAAGHGWLGVAIRYRPNEPGEGNVRRAQLDLPSGYGQFLPPGKAK